MSDRDAKGRAAHDVRLLVKLWPLAKLFPAFEALAKGH